MIGSVLSKIFGSKSDKDIKAIVPRVKEINTIYDTLSSLSDSEIISQYQDLKKELKNLIISKKEELISSNEDIDLIDETLNKLETDFLNISWITDNDPSIA